MTNRIQTYAWGSSDAIAALQRRKPSGEPEAELWMGTHPRSPSSITYSAGEGISLEDHIRRNPRTLGDRAESLGAVEGGFRGVPFLLKVLAVERALSIQAHPDREQAREGFDREDRNGVLRDAPERTYRDRNHKPELVCPLSEFWGLCGFRPAAELVKEMRAFRKELYRESPAREHGAAAGLGILLESIDSYLEQPGGRELYRLFVHFVGSDDGTIRDLLVRAGARHAEERAREHARYRWIGELLRQYPGDPGAIAPLYLNLLHLQPGEAVFLRPGVLHAYLRGTAVELMANSDNVLRAGCTNKHVDVPELLRIVRFVQSPPDRVEPSRRGLLRVYPTAAEEFELSLFRPAHGTGGAVRMTKTEGPAIILNAGGPVECDGVELGSGRSLFVEHDTREWTVSGRPGAALNGGTIVFVAALPGTVSGDA